MDGIQSNYDGGESPYVEGGGDVSMWLKDADGNFRWNHWLILVIEAVAIVCIIALFIVLVADPTNTVAVRFSRLFIWGLIGSQCASLLLNHELGGEYKEIVAGVALFASLGAGLSMSLAMGV